MPNSTRTTQTIAIWLSAMLVLLSFASAAHESVHQHEGVNTECTLCFHQHQLQKTITSTDVKLTVIRQTFESSCEPIFHSYITHQVVYHSRAPPFFS
ncbi:ABC-type zinc uptake system zinc chaperone [Shewanella olleyana]|uniref:ABC-type zinc uptake system zinc chaperone n=1 Tax=Shewanella olleyana TaxID=135626 RepID=UPI00200BA560|nr:ABC-type zinc uptake system zinc chaperone [Shewanella olleyana]MCL1067392.1 ABC-type zinc uptake system zinc chaperone [Shewanella olleyana]